VCVCVCVCVRVRVCVCLCLCLCLCRLTYTELQNSAESQRKGIDHPIHPLPLSILLAPPRRQPSIRRTVIALAVNGNLKREDVAIGLLTHRNPSRRCSASIMRPRTPPHLKLYRLTYSDRIRQDNTRWGEACSCRRTMHALNPRGRGHRGFQFVEFLN